MTSYVEMNISDVLPIIERKLNYIYGQEDIKVNKILDKKMKKSLFNPRPPKTRHEAIENLSSVEKYNCHYNPWNRSKLEKLLELCRLKNDKGTIFISTDDISVLT